MSAKGLRAAPGPAWAPIRSEPPIGGTGPAWAAALSNSDRISLLDVFVGSEGSWGADSSARSAEGGASATGSDRKGLNTAPVAPPVLACFS